MLHISLCISKLWTRVLERYRQDGSKAGKVPRGRKQFLCVWCFPLVVFTFLDSKLSCGNLQHAQVMHHTHHRPSGCLGIPWASVKSHSNSIVYIAPKIEMKINFFSPFFAMQTQLHLNTEVRIHVYIYLCYI